jgi:hypothetical protein
VTPELTNLPTLPPDQQHSLERPFTLAKLKMAVAEAAAAKAPGLDGRSYEFYATTINIAGPIVYKRLSQYAGSGTAYSLTLPRGHKPLI